MDRYVTSRREREEKKEFTRYGRGEPTRQTTAITEDTSCKAVCLPFGRRGGGGVVDIILTSLVWDIVSGTGRQVRLTPQKFSSLLSYVFQSSTWGWVGI